MNKKSGYLNFWKLQILKKPATMSKEVVMVKNGKLDSIACN